MKVHDIIKQATDKKDIFGVKTPTLYDLADKYNVTMQEVLVELKKGIKVEKEHTGDTSYALEIALDHLGEDLYYYDKLKKMESD